MSVDEFIVEHPKLWIGSSVVGLTAVMGVCKGANMGGQVYVEETMETAGVAPEEPLYQLGIHHNPEYAAGFGTAALLTGLLACIAVKKYILDR